ncbi:MAG: hypothetical protein WC054_00900 [Candidatus Nanopelagicales bacterium]
MSADLAVPPSLQEWLELNEKYDAAERAEDLNSCEELYEQIVDAWDAAPWIDRQRVNWDLFKKAWKERTKP